MNAAIRFDNKLTLSIQRWPAALHPYMLGLTMLGSVATVVVATLVIAAVVYTKQHRRLAAAFAAVVPAEVFNYLLKLVFNRARPDTQFARDMIIHTKSFPSGHSFGSMVFYGLLAYLAYTRLPHGWNMVAAAGLGLLIALIGVSRVYLGAHYSFDVLGGWLVGLAVLVIIIKLTKV